MKISPLKTLRAGYARRRQTSLLAAIVVALAIRPMIGDSGAGPIVFSFAMLFLLMMAMFAIQIDDLIGDRKALLAQRRRLTIVAWTLASAAIAERLYMIVTPTPRVLVLGTFAWLLFFSFIIWTLLRHLLKHKEVTGETISMSVSIYLLLGFAWGLLYTLILEMQPNAFLFSDADLAISARTAAHTMPVLIYFSLTTLTTVGFGDITPATLLTRYMAVAEGVTGQFYIAILVARLVGMRMSRP